jgi:Holliday junction resolvase RusA-like endonuclease
MIRLSRDDAKRLKGKSSAKSVDTVPFSKKTESNTGRKVGGVSEFFFEIWLDITPRSKERARTFVNKAMLEAAFRSSGGNMNTFTRKIQAGLMKTLTPESTREYEKRIAVMAGREMSRLGLKPCEHPIKMSAIFHLKGDPEGPWPTAQRDGDLDNMEKALLDALNGVVWTDDRLVVEKMSVKKTSVKEGIHIVVESAGAQK